MKRSISPSYFMSAEYHIFKLYTLNFTCRCTYYLNAQYPSTLKWTKKKQQQQKKRNKKWQSAFYMVVIDVVIKLNVIQRKKKKMKEKSFMCMSFVLSLHSFIYLLFFCYSSVQIDWNNSCVFCIHFNLKIK